MALTIELVPGKVFNTEEGERVTLEKMNRLGQPSLKLEGAVDTNQITDKAVTEPKLDDKSVSTRALDDKAVGLDQIQDGTPGAIIHFDTAPEGSTTGLGRPVELPPGNDYEVLSLNSDGLPRWSTVEDRLKFSAVAYLVDTVDAGVFGQNNIDVKVAIEPQNPTALVDGIWLSVKVKTLVGANTGSVSLILRNAANTPIATRKVLRTDGEELRAGDIIHNQIIELRYNTSLAGGNGAWQMMSGTASTSTGSTLLTYESAPVAIPTSGSTLTFDHNLQLRGDDKAPSLVRVVLRRKAEVSPGVPLAAFPHVSGISIEPEMELDGSSLWSGYRGSENEMFWPAFRVFTTTTQIKVHCYYPTGIAMLFNGFSKNNKARDLHMGAIAPYTADDSSVRDEYELLVYATLFDPNSAESGGGTPGGDGGTGPDITTQPAPATVSEPAAATFTLIANYALAATWYFNGVEATDPAKFSTTSAVVGGTLTASLIVNPTEHDDDDEAEVYAIVYGSGGSVTSDTVELTVNE
jgi:hypothetical protein